MTAANLAGVGERAAIVAWLRTLARKSGLDTVATAKTKTEAAATLRILADAIERGEHLS